MMRRALASLSGQLILLVVAALVVAQAISLFLFADERSLAIRAALGFEAAGRAANVARLIEEAPRDLHQSILRAANSPLIRFDLSSTPSVEHTGHSDGGIVEGRIRALMDDSYSRDIRVELHEVEGELRPLPNLSDEMTEMHLAMMRGELTAVEMNLSIAIEGSRWLNIGTRFERPPIQWPFYSMLTFGISAGLLLVAIIWFVMMRLTRPLRNLSKAADHLGRGEDVPELAIAGPTEVRDLTVAFNRMHIRLTRFVSDRTRMLAALGHDLRSEVVDLRDFLKSLCSDMSAHCSFGLSDDISVRLRPNAFRRALRNLLENAVRYGGGAQISWAVRDANLVLNIDDTGPGIPDNELQKVFDPFYRLEQSRSLETGGYGLGLSIARTIIQSHGGDIGLVNRHGVGLRAVVTIPLDENQEMKGETDETEDVFSNVTVQLARQHGAS